MTPSIVLGPGDRLRPLGAILGGLGVDLVRIEDWADLGPLALRGAPTVVIDAGSTPQEDLGFVRRVVLKNENAQVIALGEDAGTRVSRSLLALPRVRWMGWPPDLEDILSISRSLRDHAQAGASAQFAPTRPHAASAQRTSELDVDGVGGDDTNLEDTNLEDADLDNAVPHEREFDEAEFDADDVDDEIARIQAILEGNVADEEEDEEAETDPIFSAPVRSGLRAKAMDSKRAPTIEQVSFEDEESSYREIAPLRTIAPNPADELPAQPAQARPQPSPREIPKHAPPAHESAPSWWRAQVADLADAVQRLELGAQAVRLESLDPDAAEQVDMLDTEVARLVQFARTLGYVAAPPGRGEQVFNIAEMAQLFVKDLASRSEAPPRCLFRAPAYVWVQSDRALLMQVFDAVFWLAGACASGGELVRAQVKHENGTAEVRLEFPAGPLEGLELERIVEPYGLRRVLPDLGPNALSAARAILTGQGGRAELVRTSATRLEWRIELPAVEAPPNGTSGPLPTPAAGGPRRETGPGTKSIEID